MPETSREVEPGPGARSVRTREGGLLRVPADWVLVPPGDPGLTRRIKAGGPSWTVKAKRGRRVISLGVWADGARVAQIRAQLARERAHPEYERRLEGGRRRRELAQAEYAGEFEGAVLTFLAFEARHAALAAELARAITANTVDVGSGTVARTQRIPLAARAEAAVIAWLRHHTTDYERMEIARVKGERRSVRRDLAERSRRLLQRYRRGEIVEDGMCPLRAALRRGGARAEPSDG